MTPKQVIQYFGGTRAAARALGISAPSVSEWAKTGRIPPLRQLHIEQVTDGELWAASTKRNGKTRAAA